MNLNQNNNQNIPNNNSNNIPNKNQMPQNVEKRPEVQNQNTQNNSQNTQNNSQNTQNNNSNNTPVNNLNSTGNNSQNIQNNVQNNNSINNNQNNSVKNKTNSRSKNNHHIDEHPSKAPHIFLVGFAVLGAFLVLGFYAALLWALWSGQASNPFFETLGIESIGLKSLLLMMTNLIFGIITLGLLIGTLIFIFRWSLAKKTDLNKKSLLGKFFLYLLLFFFSAAAWFFLYYVITQAEDGQKKQLDNSMILTTPEDVIGLSAPKIIKFDIGENLFKKINRNVIRQINWDFDGDGKVDASGPTVNHRFLDKGKDNGRYNVTAEVFYFSSVEDKELSFKSEKEVIFSNESVAPVLTAVPESGPFPLDIEFNASESKDPDGEIILYEWDLDGDGIFERRGESPLLEETFTKVGEYEVAVRVTGQNNDSAVAKKTIQVHTPESDLKAIITSKDSLEGYAPLQITLDASQSFVKEGLITRYEWFMEGEEEPVLGRKLKRILREPGEYKVMLTVQNDLGEKQRTEKIIKVLEDDIDPDVNIRTTPSRKRNQKVLTGVVPFEVTFDASQSKIKDPTAWEWDFDNDGAVDKYGKVVKYIYRTPGTYESKLTIVDSRKKKYEKNITVIVTRSGVTAKIVATPPAGPAPITITFDGSGSQTDEGSIVNYIWEFPGQDPINYGAQIPFLFEKVGNYVVKLTILTSEGKTSSSEVIVAARAPIVKADYKVAPTAGQAPLEIKVTPFISKGIIKEYYWDFGDPAIEPFRVFRADPQRHIYNEPGEYIVTLRLVDQNGIISEKKEVIKVQ